MQLLSFLYSLIFYLCFSLIRPNSLQSFFNTPDSFVFLFNSYPSIHIFIYLPTKNFCRISFLFFLGFLIPIYVSITNGYLKNMSLIGWFHETNNSLLGVEHCTFLLLIGYMNFNHYNSGAISM
jgi:hypothetical protein